MIQGLIIKKILDGVMKKILKKYNLDKIKDYVEKPNDLDKKVKDLEKSIILLKANDHPPIFTIEKHDEIINRLNKLEKIKKGS